MSIDLYWKPYIEKKGKSLPIAMKWALQKRFFQNDYGPIVFTEKDRGYFEGLLDGKTEGAEEILDLLEKYESLELWLSE